MCLEIFEMKPSDTPGAKAGKVGKIAAYLINKSVYVDSDVTTDGKRFFIYRIDGYNYNCEISVLRIAVRPIMETACYVANYFRRSF